MPELPTPYVLGWRKWHPGTVDSHGNATEAWDTAVDLPVHGVAPGAMDDLARPDRDLSLIAYTLYCPPGTAVGERDLVVYGGVEYPVKGRPKDWAKGPWPHPTAGVVIELRRAEG